MKDITIYADLYYVVNGYARYKWLDRDLLRDIYLRIYNGAAYPEEVESLILALDHQIPQRLENTRFTLNEELLSKMMYELVETESLSEEAAKWAVESWAKALGVFKYVPREDADPSDLITFVKKEIGLAVERVYTGENNGETVPSSPGDILVIALEDNSSVGLKWKIAMPVQGLRLLASKEYHYGQMTVGMTGCGQLRLWLVEVSQRGAHELVIEKENLRTGPLIDSPIEYPVVDRYKLLIKVE